jgi:hypothetical protein
MEKISLQKFYFNRTFEINHSNEKSKHIDQLEGSHGGNWGGKNSASRARWVDFSQLIHNRIPRLMGGTIRIRVLTGSAVLDFRNNFRHGRKVAALPCRKLWNFERAHRFFTWLVSAILQSAGTRNNQ